VYFFIIEKKERISAVWITADDDDENGHESALLGIGKVKESLGRTYRFS